MNEAQLKAIAQAMGAKQAPTQAQIQAQAVSKAKAQAVLKAKAQAKRNSVYAWGVMVFLALGTYAIIMMEKAV